MKDETVTDALLREFLLGKVDDEERERIESLFLTDAQARERVLVAEQELIDDYVDGSLTTEDRERFLSVYEQTAEQRQQIRVTKSIKEWAAAHASSLPAAPARSSGWSRLRDRVRQRPLMFVPIGAMIAIAIVVAVVWLNSRTERSRQHLAIEQELAQLNSPASLREVPPQMISLELKPVTVRSVEAQNELNPRSEVRIVELRLPWIQKERYSTYQAEVRQVGDDKSVTIPDLHAENDRGYAIRFRLPTHLLTRGSYEVHLSGIAGDGTLGSSEDYAFVIGG